jgi:hypothetical protein
MPGTANQPDQTGRDDQLREQRPPTTAQSAEQRRIDVIDDRRPEELERIGQADPGQEADRLKRGALVPERVTEGAAGQHEGQARGEPQHEHHGDFRLSQRPDHVALGAGLYFCVSHASSDRLSPRLMVSY